MRAHRLSGYRNSHREGEIEAELDIVYHLIRYIGLDGTNTQCISDYIELTRG